MQWKYQFTNSCHSFYFKYRTKVHNTFVFPPRISMDVAHILKMRHVSLDFSFKIWIVNFFCSSRWIWLFRMCWASSCCLQCCLCSIKWIFRINFLSDWQCKRNGSTESVWWWKKKLEWSSWRGEKRGEHEIYSVKIHCKYLLCSSRSMLKR